MFHGSLRGLLAGTMAAPLLLVHQGAAWAQTAEPEPSGGTSRTVAEALFREARTLMGEERFDEACPKFAESYRLEPTSGTLLGLAMCHEAQGKLASAWAEYQEVMVAARTGQRADRAQYAQERIDHIEPRLIRVTITATAQTQGMILRLDGVELGQAALGIATPMDPGQHTLEVAAPGYRPWTHRFVVDETTGSGTTIVVPALDPVPASPAPARVAPAPGRADAPESSASLWNSLSLPVKIAGGSSVALGAAAIGTGIYALSKAHDFDDANADPERTYGEREALRESASNWAAVSTVLSVGAVVGLGITAYFYFSDTQSQAAATLPLELLVEREGVQIGWRGSL